MHDREIAIGLVGAGRIARRVHLPVLGRLAGARVAAIADPDPEARAAGGALAPHARLYAGIEEMLRDTAVDAVVVCAPTALHARLATAAFADGRPVYLEKPLAASLADGRAVIGAQRAAEQVGMTGFMLRFSPVFREARRLIASGAIGDVVAARSVFTTSLVDAPTWKRHPSTGGGALLDLFSHHADTTRWLLGDEIESVVAEVRSVVTADDIAAVQATTTSGVAVQTLVSTSAVDDHRFEVVGTTGRLVADPWQMPSPECHTASSVRGRRDRVRRLTPARVLHRPDYHEPFRGALAAFVEAVRSGHAREPDLMDGLASLAIVEAAAHAARSGGRETVQATRTAAAGRMHG